MIVRVPGIVNHVIVPNILFDVSDINGVDFQAGAKRFHPAIETISYLSTFAVRCFEVAAGIREDQNF